MSFDAKPCSCPEYEDLSPNSRMECREQLDQEIEALTNKRRAFEEVENVDPNERTLLVVGVYKNRMPEACDFVSAFDELRSLRGRFEGNGIPVFSGFEVLHEKNSKFQDGAWKQVDECYIRTRGVKEARFLLELPTLNMVVKECKGVSGYSVRFVRAAQDDAKRRTFNAIHELVKRLPVVTKELDEIGIEMDWGGFGLAQGVPKVSSNKYVDKAVFDANMVEWERLRDSGAHLSCQAYVLLLTKIPVDIKELTKHMLELYKEKCYILMQLRKLQSNGFKFTF